MCLKQLKIFVLGLFLLLSALPATYSLTEAETQELNEILTSLNSGLTTLEAGLNEIKSGQQKSEGELNVLSKEAKKLDEDLKKQRQELKTLRALQKDLRASSIRLERMNKWLTIGAASATGLAIAAMVIAVLN